MDSNYLQDLFINEAKAIAGFRNTSVTDEQISEAVNNYLEKNPIEADPATATIENGVLKVS